MAQSKKKKTQKKSVPVTQIFLGVAILLVVVLITAIFTSRNIRSDRTVLVSSSQENVLLRHYMYFLNSMRFEYENEWAQYGSSAEEMAELWNTVEDGITWGDHLKMYALESAKGIFTELHLAKQAGYKETPELLAQTNKEIDDVVSSVFGGSATPNTDFYKAYGLTIDEMKTLQLYISLVNDWRGGVYENIEVTEAQARAFFDENSYYFEKVVARHVLIATEGMDEDEKAEAEALAYDILEQINEGADIGELAAIYSDDGGSAENNGEYEFGRGEMVTEFEDWAFSAEVGETGVVETNFGYHVMQLMRGATTFEDIQDDVTLLCKDDETNHYIEHAIEDAGFVWTLNENAYRGVKLN